MPKKLGIKKGSVVSLVDAPPGFARTLGKLPEGAAVHNKVQSGAGVTLWFVRSRRELENNIRRMTPLASKGALWIAWPKKSSGESADLRIGRTKNWPRRGPRGLQDQQFRC